MTPSLCIEEMYMAFFIILFNKERTKDIHQKIQSLHSTPTNPTMVEYHAHKALCVENNKIPPIARNHEP
jgi:hypothetical protein